jgi:hypothetical protein
LLPITSNHHRDRVPPIPTYSIDPLYPHWFRCDLCGMDVAEVLPAEPMDLVNLTAGQVLSVCPDVAEEIHRHEHGCLALRVADAQEDWIKTWGGNNG